MNNKDCVHMCVFVFLHAVAFLVFALFSRLCVSQYIIYHVFASILNPVKLRVVKILEKLCMTAVCLSNTAPTVGLASLHSESTVHPCKTHKK